MHETYAPGAVVTLTAGPAAGSGFTRWGGACTGTGRCVVTMSAARAVTATFTKFRLTVATAGVGAGTWAGPGSRACGRRSSATSAARDLAHGRRRDAHRRAAAGSGFTGWGGACTGTGVLRGHDERGAVGHRDLHPRP